MGGFLARANQKYFRSNYNADSYLSRSTAQQLLSVSIMRGFRSSPSKMDYMDSNYCNEKGIIEDGSIRWKVVAIRSM